MMTVKDLKITIETEAGAFPVSARLFLPEDPVEHLLLYLSGASLHPDRSATNDSYDDVGNRLCRGGTAVLIPDGIGYGAGFGRIQPRYLHRGYAGLDSFHLLRAVLSEQRPDATLPVTICGYSQGAYHALALLKRLKAAVPFCRPRLFIGGGIYDLQAQFAAMLKRGSYAMPAYIVHLLGSLLGPEKILECFAPAWHLAIRTFYADGRWNLAALNDALPRELHALFSAAMFPAPPAFVTEALITYSLEPLEADGSDITLYHTPHDELCAIENLESYLEHSACEPTLLLGSAPSHLEGSREYFERLIQEVAEAD